MNTSPVLLSIEVMTSGTRPELRKCIASLKHLRKVISCQLIVVDTGCSDDDMRAYIEDKADIVVDFEWCNDFAAARNAGLAVSTGSWFMFMDDDEWFESTSMIEKFFRSGDYRKYTCADYLVRNYWNLEGTNYTDTRASRMHRITGDLRFYGYIHEEMRESPQPDNEKEVCKYLKDFAHHYGYARARIFKEEDRQSRNRPLVEKMVLEEPAYPKWRYQLIKEYMSSGDYGKAARTSADALKIIDHHKITYMFLYSFYLTEINGLYMEGKNEEALERIDYYRSDALEAREFYRPAYYYFCAKLDLYISMFLMRKNDADGIKRAGSRYINDSASFLQEIGAASYLSEEDALFLSSMSEGKSQVLSGCEIADYIRFYSLLVNHDIIKAINQHRVECEVVSGEHAVDICSLNNIMQNLFRAYIITKDYSAAADCFSTIRFESQMLVMDDDGFIAFVAEWVATHSDLPQTKEIVAHATESEWLRNRFLREVKKAQRIVREQSLKEHKEETDILSRNIKDSVRKLIDSGDYENAKNVLKQLLSFIPDDEDARRILQDVKHHMPMKTKSIVFLWDDFFAWQFMKPLYKAALADRTVSAYVLPVPYYGRRQDGGRDGLMFEGENLKGEVATVSFKEFILEKEHPDIIFIPEMYDVNKKNSEVYPDFTADILLRNTDLLVRVSEDHVWTESEGVRVFGRIVYGV